MPPLDTFRSMTCISDGAKDILESAGYVTVTPVQAATIPLFCGHKDVAVDAATGSGKTLAYVVPLVERLRSSAPAPNEVQAMVICPTRELALQVHSVVCTFRPLIPASKVSAVIGGTQVAGDVKALRTGANCLVGTPGRLWDIMNRISGLSYKSFEMLVLDEADKLLDMGFQRQLDSIMGRLPKQRRTGLFSATQTEAVSALVRAGLRNPFRVNVAVSSAAPSTSALPDAVAPRKVPSTLQVSYLFVHADGKAAQLVHFLRQRADKKCIVYFLTCASVDFFASVLPVLPGAEGLQVMALHGGMKQAKRQRALQAFTDTPSATLLCTDLAARGLDIPNVHWVLHFDPPQNPANFVHRCGRTARIGRPGAALALLLPQEDAYVELLKGRGVPLEAHVDGKASRPPRGVGAACALSVVPGTEEVCAALRTAAETDRDIMLKGTRAFVAHMRGYKEHQCGFIFRLGKLNLNHLGRLFGLLRIPAMKEVRKVRNGLSEFVISEVHPDDVPFKDKVRERERKAHLRKDAGKAPAHKDKKSHKDSASCKGKTQPEQQPKLPANKRQQLQRRQDADDMDADFKLLKKLKRRKVSEGEYERMMGMAEDEAC